MMFDIYVLFVCYMFEWVNYITMKEKYIALKYYSLELRLHLSQTTLRALSLQQQHYTFSLNCSPQ